MASVLEVALRISMDRSQYSQTRAGLQSISRQLQTVRNQVLGFLGVAGAQGLIRELAQVSDEYKSINGRLKIATDSAEEFNYVQQQLFKTAQDARAPLESVTDLYLGIDQVQKELNATQAEMIRFTDGVAKSLTLQGSTAQQSAGALLQLRQALGSQNIEAEEFNSLLDGARVLLQTVADNLDETGGSVSRLRDLVRQGKITNQDFFNAFLQGVDDVDEHFKQLPPTISGGLTRIRNEFLRTVGQVDAAKGWGESVATLLSSVANSMEELLRALYYGAVALAGIYATQLVGSISASVQAWLAQRAAAQQAAAAQALQRAETIAAIQAEVAATEARAMHARMLLAEAEAAVAAATGIQRLAIAEQQLIPSQRAAAAAAETHAAALKRLEAATVGPTKGLRGMIKEIGLLRTSLALLASGAQLLFAAFTGFQIGSYLYEQFAIARLGGNYLVQGLMEVKEALQLVFEATQALFTGDTVEAAVDRYQRRVAEMRRIFSEMRDDIRFGVDQQGGPNAGNGYDPNVRPDAPTAPIGGTDAMARVRAEQDALNEVFKARLEGLRNALDREAEAELIGKRELIRRRAELEEQALDREVTDRRARLNVATAEERQQLTSELAALELQRADLHEQTNHEIAQLDRELADERRRIELDLLEAQGQTLEARLAEISDQYANLVARLEREGDSAGAALARRLQAVEENRARLAEIERQIQASQQAVQTGEQSIAAQRTAGLITEREARERIIRLHRNQAAAIRELLPEYERLARASGDPQAIAGIEAIQTAVLELETVTSEAALRIKDGLESGFTEAFTSILDGAKSVKDAFQDMLQSFVQMLNRMVAEALARQVMESVLGGTGGGTGGQGGGNWVQQGVALLAGMFHSGGIAGGTAPGRRRVPAFAFAVAPRYHGGGIAGLAPDEVPAILRRGEEVLTADDPRHRANGGTSVTVNINGVSDYGSFRSNTTELSARIGDAVRRGQRNR